MNRVLRTPYGVHRAITSGKLQRGWDLQCDPYSLNIIPQRPCEEERDAPLRVRASE